MNPIFIKLKNFRNYKDEKISFPHNGIMPIVGKNGTGKSTIFYGILLALYGKVLVDGIEVLIPELIIDDGSTDMELEYHFSHNGSVYNVIRVYDVKTSKKGVSKCSQLKCEFNQFIGDKKISLTSKSKGITTEKIIDIVGKDCDNFCNSAFFPQGEENRLAKLKPAEFITEFFKLKKITIWEDLRIRVSKKLDSIKLLIESSDVFINECKEEIEIKPDVQEKLTNLNKQILETKGRITEIENNIAVINEEKSNLSMILDTLLQVEEDVRAITGEIEDFKGDINSIDVSIVNFNNIVAEKVSINERFVEHQSVEARKTAMDQISIKINNLLKNISVLENQINIDKQNVETSYQQAVTTYNNASLVLQNAVTVNQRYEQCQNGLTSIGQTDEQISSIDSANQQMLMEITKLKTENKHLTKQIDEETSKTKRFISSKMCSECERPVDEAGIEFIKNKKIIKIDGYKEQGRSNADRIMQLESELAGNKSRLVILNEQTNQRMVLNKEIGQLENQMNNISVAQNTVDNFGPEIERLKLVIDNGDYSERFNELSSIKSEYNNISQNYNSKEHTLVNDRYEELRNIGILKENLSQAEQQLPELDNRRITLLEKIEKKEKRVLELSNKLEKSNGNDIKLKLQDAENKTIVASNELSVKNDEFGSLMTSFGAQQEVMERIDRREKQLKDKQEEIKENKEQQYLYEMAIDMYSKTGIPTLIMESMLPEIEIEANELLKVMESDKAITFERPKKADGTYQDKIIIMIRDARGKKRKFNTFSGAECFQLSFAIRIAICGEDDVMFIDEGFGKLDADNLNLVVRTLSTLKNRFSKIILITHIEKLIDMFDIKLDVSLDNEGYSVAKWQEVV